MSDIFKKLDRVEEAISNEKFLTNKGLLNEVGLYVFCYDPKDEIIVRDHFNRLKERKDVPYNLVECDLYKIFLQICEDKRILEKIPDMEEKRGTDFLLQQLQKVATPEMFVEKMRYENHQKGDVLLITGVGKAYPFVRAHKIFENIQHLFDDMPVLLLYPGVYDGQSLELFGKFLEANYYRAFNMI